MTIVSFHEKIALALSFLILNNYLLLSLNLPLILVNINLLIFLFVLIFYYFKNFSENIFLKVFFLFIIFISLGTPLYEWDPRSIWLFHAKRIFYDVSVFSFADNYAQFSQNDLPNLIPAFAASTAFLIGYWNEVFPKISFSLAFLPPLIFIYPFLKNTKYLIFLSIIFFTIGKYLFNGWADGLLAVYFGTSAFLMYILFINEFDFYRKNKFFYLIAICFFISLTLIKNEGILLLLILFFTTFLIKLYKGQLKKYFFNIIILSIAFLPIVLWKIFCFYKGISYSHFVNANTLFNFMTRFDDLKNYGQISYFLFLNEKFLISFTFFSISFWINRNKDLFLFVSISILIYISVLFFIYLSTPYDFYWQLNSTAARVLKTISFSLTFFGVYNLNNYRIRDYNVR